MLYHPDSQPIQRVKLNTRQKRKLFPNPDSFGCDSVTIVTLKPQSYFYRISSAEQNKMFS